MPVILIDQDGPLADFESGFLNRWRKRYPHEFYVPLHNRRSFHVRNDYPEELHEKVEGIYNAAGFYRDLPPVPGSVAALRELVKLGCDVRICSAPLDKYRYCVVEKYDWVKIHIGEEFLERIIHTKNKSFIRGQILVDDRPDPRGEDVAEWEHIVYDYPYNRDVKGKRRLTWNNWRDILEPSVVTLDSGLS